MLVIRSVPSGADVTMREEGQTTFRPAGTTPCEVQRRAGAWIVRLEKPCYEPVEDTVTLVAGQQNTQRFALKPAAPGFVQVIVSPEFADVYVDGDLAESQTRSATVELPCGHHEVAARRGTEVLGEWQVDVQAGETTVLRPN